MSRQDADSPPARRVSSPGRGQALPPGRIKIADALRQLLAEKDFNAITTAEIAATAGVAEALIYKHFRDKRDLLHQVLAEYLEHYICLAEKDVSLVQGSLNRLKAIVRSHIAMYANDRVFARILLLEVRNFPDYFKSDAYRMVQRYAKIVQDIIEEGVERGEIRRDVPIPVIRQLVLGSIEHACLPAVIFNRSLSLDELTAQLCDLLLGGIASHGTE
jgi:TetR/AcrR family transcriptional regulator, fatty acid metabolism regulator protein